MIDSRRCELRYKPWGEVRYGSIGSLTTFKFTGQRAESALGGSEGLYFYGARFYDPSLGRFTSPDSIIPDPGNPQSWDRFAGMDNNPVRYTDPSGHNVDCNSTDSDCKELVKYEKKYGDDKAEFVRRVHKRFPNSPDWFLDQLPFAATGTIIHEILTGDPHGWDDLFHNWRTVGQAIVFITPGSDDPEVGGDVSDGEINATDSDAGGDQTPWKFGSNKSSQKWANQMEQRGWTEQQITEAIQYGESYPAVNNINPSHTATRYVNPTTGRSVVVDNVTGEVIHIGGDGFEY